MTEPRFTFSKALQIALLAVLPLAAHAALKPSDSAPSDTPARTNKPLPSGRDAYTLKKYNEDGRQWMERALLKNYDTCGVRSPLWDEKAKTFLVKYAAFRYGSNRPEQLAEAKRAGDDLMGTACSDPHLLYAYGNVLFQLGELKQAEPFVRKGFTLLETSAYPRYYLYYGANRLAVIDEKTGSRKQERATLIRKKMQYLGQAAADADFANGHQRYYAELALDEFDKKSGLSTEGEAFIRELESRPNVEPWIRLFASGLYHTRKAWQARGSGWACEVPEQGWKGFGEELDQARKCLEEAHALHPEYPEAAAQMITVSMGSCGGGDERVWFDRAVAAQFDYWSAYSQLMWALRPRWGGSHKEMLQFGGECLSTKRFDTDVPQFFLKALSDIGSELGDWRDAYKQPGVYEQVKAYYKGALEEPSNASRLKPLMTAYAVASWAAGRYAEAKTLFDQLGDGAQAAGFADFGVEPSLVVGETRLRCGPARDTFEQAEALFANGQSLNALPLFEELRRAAAADLKALFFVNDRLASLKLKAEFQKGGWVNLMPGPELLGWEKRGGHWCVEADGALKGMPQEKDVRQLLLLTCRVGPDYELKGELETKYRAGVALGHAKHLSPAFAGFKIDKFKNSVCLSDRFRTGSSEIQRAEALGPRNRFHIRVSKGRLTAYVNDKPVFVDQPIEEDWWSPDDGQIGLGSSLTLVGVSDFRFRDLQIRKIDEAATPLGGTERL